MRSPAICLALLIVGGIARAEPGPKWALLVGVQKYKHLGPSEQLNGCRNDVDAFRRLLLEPRFGFREDDITTLLDDAATGDAIRAALQKLTQRVRELPTGAAPAQVVFHFSGHGSQIADQERGHPDHDEDDGLDETLVPHDASKQGGPEDLRDDELYRFVDAVCESGKARLWVVLDCCHSGTGARGTTAIRKLDRNLPGPTAGSGQQPAVAKRLAPGAVVLSACRAREVEPEYQDGNNHFGLLTRFVVQTLGEKNKLSDFSYDLLRQTIVSRYRQDSAVLQPPVPQLEGDGASLRGAVLGAGTNADRPPYWNVVAAGSDRAAALIKAGEFHGVAVGSLYELYDQAEQIVWKPQGKASGETLWLRVDKAEGATARARVFRWRGDQQEETVLPTDFKDGVVVERFRQHGAFGIRLRVVRTVDEQTDGPALLAASPEVPAPVRDALAKLNSADESPWLTWGDANEPCDLLLRIDGDAAALFPATGRCGLPRVTRGRGKLVGGWGPIDLGAPDARQTLQKYLRQICRARNLLRLAETRRDSADVLPLKLELLSVDVDATSQSITKSRPWTPTEGGLVVKRGDLYAYRVTHPEATGKPWFITLLHVDPDFGIDQILPFQESEGSELFGEQELRPGESRITDAFECQSGFGSRTVIALATREPNSYYMLSQPSLPKVRGSPTRGGIRGSLDSGSSLSQLLLEQTYFQTRGGDPRRRPQKLYDETWTATTLPFVATP